MSKNNKSRNHNNNQCFDTSLHVATKRDILFTPILDETKRFLKLVTSKLKDDRKIWNKKNTVIWDVNEGEDLKYLLNLDPVQWKDQDHYAVLGLKYVRINATEEDIKKAYRIRCLRHHPDKRQAAGEKINPEGDYFACIVKAYEILGVNGNGRKAYDSVDPFFDDYIPYKIKTENFFTEYGKWFELNSRWSTKTPVPLLGNMYTPREKVEHFYDFWFEFDSWREYSYLDEEDKEKGSFREERKWIDRQNKMARAKRKKEENQRIRMAVESAYKCDPRIVIFKENDKQIKLDKKIARQSALKEKQLEEEKAMKEAEEKALMEQRQKEAEDREKEMNYKKEREVVKKALKKERKNLRAFCKTNDYFADDEREFIENVTRMEHLCETLQLNELEELNAKLASLSPADARTLFLVKVGVMAEPNQVIKTNGTTTPVDDKQWSAEEQKLFEDALKTHTKSDPERWEKIASCVPGRSKKECKDRFRELAAFVKAKKSGTNISAVNSKS